MQSQVTPEWYFLHSKLLPYGDFEQFVPLLEKISQSLIPDPLLSFSSTLFDEINYRKNYNPNYIVAIIEFLIRVVEQQSDNHIYAWYACDAIIRIGNKAVSILF